MYNRRAGTSYTSSGHDTHFEREVLITAKRLRNGVLLVVSFTYAAWSPRVAFLSFDSLSDLTLAGVLNEALRAVIFPGPVLLYLRYVEKAPVLRFLQVRTPRKNALWILPVAGAPEGFWRANVFSSLLFILIHFPGWYTLGQFSTPLVVVDAAGIFVFDLVFGLATRRPAPCGRHTSRTP